MRHDKTLTELWESAPTCSQRFQPADAAHLPPVARRYIQHALSEGAPRSTCARITMTGAIKLERGWSDFEAEQVLRWDRGFVWAGRVSMGGIPVTGYDRLVDGAGAMKWKLLGLFPVATAEGPEIARSAAGRLHAEAMWMPAVLLEPSVTWTDDGPNRTIASFEAHGEHTELAFDVDDSGRVVSVHLPRWGDLNTGEFSYYPFGASLSGETTNSGITIPKTHRVGWWYGTPRFEDDGEFFRCTLESVSYR